MSDRREQLHSLSIDRSEEISGGGIGLVGVAVIALLAAGAGAGASWWFFGQDTAPAAPAPTPVAAVDTPAPAQTTPAPTPAETVTRAPRAGGLVASGYVVARRQATVSAEITGRIREVLVEEGTVVEAGQVVARLDDTRARLQLDLLRAQFTASQANILSLEAQLAEARRVLARAETLVERNFTSEATLTASQSQVDSLAGQLAAARANLAASRVSIASQEDLVDRHVVRAPFSGVVIAKNAQVGEILSPASAGGGFTRTGVATVVDMESLEIEVDVNEGQIGRISAGQAVEARLDAYPDWRIRAEVAAIIPTADRSRATIRVRVAFLERDERILPDMASRVTFIE